MNKQIMLSCLKRALEKTFDEFSKEIQSNVETNIYEKPKSQYYDRTGDFLKAVESAQLELKTDGEFSINLIDDKKLRAKNGKKRKFGHHKSFPWDDPYPDNDEVKENLYTWLDEGFTILGKKYHKGFNFDVGAAFEKGNPFYEKFLENAFYEMNKYLRKGE